MLKWLTNKFGKARLMCWVMSFYSPYLGADTLVARVGKTLYMRLKPQARQA
ncbi:MULTISPECIES: hypothetical protein [unclassified Pseudomonas]|uniref:hypothetical protein n=1 Tax=Pseudomonas TaxID=286 RepID=UPI0024B37467|nr:MULTISPECIES: hypothetical protein [unclassified Pseudomonas]